MVSAVITLALPQFALAHTSNGQSSAAMQDSRTFTHWESMGSAGPEPIQSIDGKKIPGAPKGMLAEMAEFVTHGQSMCRTPADADFAALPLVRRALRRLRVAHVGLRFLAARATCPQIFHVAVMVDAADERTSSAQLMRRQVRVCPRRLRWNDPHREDSACIDATCKAVPCFVRSPTVALT